MPAENKPLVHRQSSQYLPERADGLAWLTACLSECASPVSAANTVHARPNCRYTIALANGPGVPRRPRERQLITRSFRWRARSYSPLALLCRRSRAKPVWNVTRWSGTGSPFPRAEIAALPHEACGLGSSAVRRSRPYVVSIPALQEHVIPPSSAESARLPRRSRLCRLRHYRASLSSDAGGIAHRKLPARLKPVMPIASKLVVECRESRAGGDKGHRRC